MESEVTLLACAYWGGGGIMLGKQVFCSKTGRGRDTVHAFHH